MNQDIYHPIGEAPASSHNIEIPIDQCLFCSIEIHHPERIPTIEKTILLCNNCHNLLLENYSEIDQQNKCKLHYDPIFSRASVHTKQKFMPYGIQKGQCQICYDDNKFLHKFGECNHYFCFLCLQELVNNNLIVTCPFQGCQMIMHDYLKLQLSSYPSKLVKPYMVCCKRKCRVKLSVEPFQDMKPISVIIQGDKAHCSECNTTFCSKCWHKHSGNCPYDSLFLDSFSRFNIVRCPNCSVFGSAQPCEEDDLGNLFLFRYFNSQKQVNFKLMLNNVHCVNIHFVTHAKRNCNILNRQVMGNLLPVRVVKQNITVSLGE